MMNYIWTGLVLIAVVAAAVTGNMQAVLDNIFAFAQTGAEIAIDLIGIMAFFCGLMKLMEVSGLAAALGRFIAPVMTKLFPDVPATHPAHSQMALWMAANMIGIGNAATPIGLKAISELQKLNPTKSIATNAQCMMLAIGTTSVTLLPVTVIAFRTSIQPEGAVEILVPVIIATTISTVTGIVCTLLFQNLKAFKWENIIEKEIAAGTLELNPNYEGPDGKGINPIVLPEGYKLKYAKEEK